MQQGPLGKNTLSKNKKDRKAEREWLWCAGDSSIACCYFQICGLAVSLRVPVCKYIKVQQIHVGNQQALLIPSHSCCSVNMRSCISNSICLYFWGYTRIKLYGEHVPPVRMDVHLCHVIFDDVFSASSCGVEKTFPASSNTDYIQKQLFADGATHVLRAHVCGKPISVTGHMHKSGGQASALSFSHLLCCTRSAL